MNQRELDVPLVLFNMTTKDQIVQVLKEARKPLKAREIARKFELHFNEKISQQEVNKIIFHQLSSKILCSRPFPTYFRVNIYTFYGKYSLIEEVKNLVSEISINNKHEKQKEINFDRSTTQTTTDREITISEKIYLLIDEYTINFHKFRNTKDNILRDNCLIKIEEIVEYIISNNLNVDDISKYLEKEVLIHKQIVGHKRVIKFFEENYLQIDQKKIQLHSSTINNELLQLIQKYESTYSDFIKLNRKPSNIKSTFSDLINKLEKKLTCFIDLIVKNILTNNISLTNLENNCSRDLYVKIENNNDIYSWVSRKDENQSIDLDTYKDRLKEFKILCKQVWEDGVVDEEEQIEIDERIVSLGLEREDANEIFEQIKGEYSYKQVLEKGDDTTLCIRDTIFHIKQASIPFHPLFSYHFCAQTGNETITINTSHDIYNKNSQEIIVMFACTIYYTKMNMTSQDIEIFIDRFHNILNNEL